MSANGVTDLTRAATEARAATEPKAPMVPQYATGFEGAASAPFAPEAAAILGAPVNEAEVEIRPDGIVYLPGVAYRRILTRAFGVGAWALLPRGPSRPSGEAQLYHGALFILGRFVSEAVGECRKSFGMSEASAMEGARTDCLTRCCKDLGMASELWDPTWREAWQEKYAQKEWREAKEPGKKGSWHWSLKTKGGTFALPTGRNAGPAEATPAPKADAGAAGAAPAEVTAASPDTGEAPDATVISGIRKAVKALTWKPGYAKIWLRGAFGVESPDALTAVQAADALQLLEAAQVDDNDATYGEVRAKLVAAGRVKAS